MKSKNERLTRRDMLKLSGFALGGFALAGTTIGSQMDKVPTSDTCKTDCTCPDGPTCDWTDLASSQRYTYYEKLPEFYPFRDPPGVFPPAGPLNTTIREQGPDEMRITFMGSSVPPMQRKVGQMMSVFVEVGWDPDRQMPLDNFVFDCGSGVTTNYASMNVSLGRMNKVFVNHLHGDHMGDMTHIYCFGPGSDRLSPLYVWGPGPSGVKAPERSGWVPRYYKDGTQAFCEHLREACRWHSESFSFLQTSYTPSGGWPSPQELQAAWGLPSLPVPVSDDPPNDGYALIPFELTLENYWAGKNIAYDNKSTGVKITYFPVIHARKGSLGYKLEWTPPVPGARTLSMIYTSDTKPEELSIEQAKNNGQGVDVFIHEMSPAAQIWAMKGINATVPPDPESPVVQNTAMVQNSSHTPQGAFGYMLSRVVPRPRLTVAAHFPVADDTVACAMKSVIEHCPDAYQVNMPQAGTRITWPLDLMVISVSGDQILEQKGVVSSFNNSATIQPIPSGQKNPPKYRDANGYGDPYAQIETSTAIDPCDCDTGECHYRVDGY